MSDKREVTRAVLWLISLIILVYSVVIVGQILLGILAVGVIWLIPGLKQSALEVRRIADAMEERNKLLSEN